MEPLGSAQKPGDRMAGGVVAAIAVSHLLNDMMQALVPAIYPILKADLGLTFGQIGMVTLAYQVIASILQPLVGIYADRRPTPLALPGATLFTLVGLVLLSVAHSYALLLAGASLLGVGSAIFHPEASRVALMASGPRRGLAQSLFQVGGNAGSAIGPLAAAIVVVRWGQVTLAGFALLAPVAGFILWRVAVWCRDHGGARPMPSGPLGTSGPPLPRRQVNLAIGVLLALLFSKWVYLACLTNYLTFYMIERFGVSVDDSQLYLFVFLAAVAVGTVAGGPIGDRFGRKHVIWFSILGALPFTLALPFVSVFWVGPLSVVVGLILASAFPAIVVYAQELVPGKVGMVSGLLFGFSFGVGGVGAGLLGLLADATDIETVFLVCAFLPAIGLLAAFLPGIRERPRTPAAIGAAMEAGR